MNSAHRFAFKYVPLLLSGLVLHSLPVLAVSPFESKTSSKLALQDPVGRALLAAETDRDPLMPISNTLEEGSESEFTRSGEDAVEFWKENAERAEKNRCEDRRRLEGKFDDEGFALVTSDEEFELRFHVLNQVDYKSFSPGAQDPAAQDGVYIPRMRVYLEGKLTDPFRYEVSLQRSVEGQFDLLDANVDIRFSEGLQFRFGRTLIPYSYTWYDHLEQWFIVPERPLFPLNFGLARAAGIQMWGQDETRAWQYSMGLYDGRVTGLADDSTTLDGVGYLNFRPFVGRRGGFFQNLNVGGSIVIGENQRPAETLPLRTSIQSSENDEAAISASALFLEFNDDIVGSGNRHIGAIHVTNYVGPMSFESEWNIAEGEFVNETTDKTTLLQAQGFHITLALFLTGETIRGRELVKPLRPFDPRCGCSNLGACEAFVRFSYLRIGDEVFDEGLAEEDEWTNEVAMTDIGINWYLNQWVKFYFDWQHAAYAQPVLINEGSGTFTKANDLAWMRCQFWF